MAHYRIVSSFFAFGTLEKDIYSPHPCPSVLPSFNRSSFVFFCLFRPLPSYFIPFTSYNPFYSRPIDGRLTPNLWKRFFARDSQTLSESFVVLKTNHLIYIPLPPLLKPLSSLDQKARQSLPIKQSLPWTDISLVNAQTR